MNPLLPDRLKGLWKSIEAKQLTPDDYEPLKEKWFAEYRALWDAALITDKSAPLKQNLLAELGRYVGITDLAEMERFCRTAPADLAKEWDAWVDAKDRTSVESFYNKSKAEIYGLLWWHTLQDDDTPLSYILANQFAQQQGSKGNYLDFGSGVGSGAVVFRQAGFDVTCADISSPMLDFCKFRLQSRNWPGHFIDLKTETLPTNHFDFITAMDVFEHLYDPVDAIERLHRSMRPGAHIYGRWAVETGDDRRGHIVADMAPTHRRMKELGLIEVWRDDWCWGHQVFRKG